MTLTTRCLAALLAVCLLAPAAPAQPQGQPLTLNGVDLGNHAGGPDISVNDLRGRVVAFEYWGITCGPCIRAIPHTAQLAQEYGHERLVVVANQVWTASDDQTGEVWAEHASNNMVAVRNGGSVPGAAIRGVPSVLLFDHTGTMVWQGHPGAMDQPLAEAIAAIPAGDSGAELGGEESSADDPLAGVEVQRLTSLARQLQQLDRPAGRALRSLRQAAAGGVASDEASAMLEALGDWADTRAQQVVQLREQDPAEADLLAGQTMQYLDGDELAQRFRVAAGLPAPEAPPAAQRLIEQARILAERAGLTGEGERDEARADLVRRRLDMVIDRWPGTTAAEQATELMSEYGLADGA
jgi:thiol-disulfide isomerase/thioredoxin